MDDDPADRKLFSHILQKAGLNVIATGDPQVALEQIVAGNVGCIITDQSMKPSGHELVRIVKSVRSDIQMIFLSGAESPSQPLPSEIQFINKQDKERLASEVLKCMARWQR